MVFHAPRRRNPPIAKEAAPAISERIGRAASAATPANAPSSMGRSSLQERTGYGECYKYLSEAVLLIGSDDAKA